LQTLDFQCRGGRIRTCDPLLPKSTLKCSVSFILTTFAKVLCFLFVNYLFVSEKNAKNLKNQIPIFRITKVKFFPEPDSIAKNIFDHVTIFRNIRIKTETNKSNH